MAIDFPQRVLFEDDRPLQAADLDEEYLYHLQRRWQHNLALHSWGILCGLEIVCTESKPQQPLLEIRPGMALDGFGRELVLTTQRRALSQQLLDPSQSYDIWIRYHVSRSESPAGNDDCIVQDYPLARWQEDVESLVLLSSDRQSGSVTKPKEVRVADLSFAPYQPMKFDSANTWPVFLGRIERTGNRWVVDHSERHYGGLRAQRIENPYLGAPESTTTSTTEATASVAEMNTAILNGPQSGDPDMRFAVAVMLADEKAKNSQPEKATAQAKSSPKNFMPLCIKHVAEEKIGNNTINAEHHAITFASQRLVANHDLAMTDGARLVFEPIATQDQRNSAVTLDSIHREFRMQKKTVAVQDVLQFEMPSTAEDRTAKISFGTVDASGTFLPVLEIAPDAVSIYGTLRVQGTIAGITSDAEINPNDFRNANLDQLKVLLGANEALQVSLLEAAFEKVAANKFEAAYRNAPDQKKIAEPLLKVLLDDAVVNQAYEAITSALTQVNSKVRNVFTGIVSELVSNIESQKLAAAMIAHAGRKETYKLIAKDLVVELCQESETRKLFAQTLLDLPNLKLLVADMLGQASGSKLTKAFLESIDAAQRKAIIAKLFTDNVGLVDIALSKDEFVQRIWKKENAKKLADSIDLMDFDESVAVFVNDLSEEEKQLFREKLGPGPGEGDEPGGDEPGGDDPGGDDPGGDDPGGDDPGGGG